MPVYYNLFLKFTEVSLVKRFEMVPFNVFCLWTVNTFNS